MMIMMVIYHVNAIYSSDYIAVFFTHRLLGTMPRPEAVEVGHFIAGCAYEDAKEVEGERRYPSTQTRLTRARLT